MTLQPEDLQTAGPETIDAFPKRIEPAKHGGAMSRKFAAVLSAGTLEVGTPVAFNETLDAWQAWDPNTSLPADVNEVQSLLIAANIDGGTYKLVWMGQATTGLAFNANAAAIDAALEALSNIPAGGVTVTGTNPFAIAFTGALAGAPQELIEVDSSLLLDGTDAAGGATVTQTTAGVTGGAVNEVVTIDEATGTVTAGAFTITFDGQTTDPIDWDSSAADVLAAVIALSNVPAGGFTASGGALPGTAVVLTAAGAFVGADLPQMFVDSSGLTGGTISAVTTTQGDVSEGDDAPAGKILGFVYPDPIDLLVAGEVFGVVMHKGSIHHDDVVLPTVGSPTQAQLDQALRDGLLQIGLQVQGLSNAL